MKKSLRVLLLLSACMLVASPALAVAEIDNSVLMLPSETQLRTAQSETVVVVPEFLGPVGNEWYLGVSGAFSGSVAASSSTQSKGVTASLEFGKFLTPRLSVGAMAQQSVGFGTSYGGITLNIFAGTYAGGVIDYAVIPSKQLTWRIGASVGYGSFTGIGLIFSAVPAAAGSYGSVMGGPRTSLEFYLGKHFDLLLDVSTLWVPAGSASSYHSLASNSPVMEVPNTLLFRSGLGLRIRM